MTEVKATNREIVEAQLAMKKLAALKCDDGDVFYGIGRSLVQLKRYGRHKIGELEEGLLETMAEPGEREGTFKRDKKGQVVFKDGFSYAEYMIRREKEVMDAEGTIQLHIEKLSDVIASIPEATPEMLADAWICFENDVEPDTKPEAKAKAEPTPAASGDGATDGAEPAPAPVKRRTVTKAE